MKKRSSKRPAASVRQKPQLSDREMAREDARDSAVVARRLKRKEPAIRFSSDDAMRKHFGV